MSVPLTDAGCDRPEHWVVDNLLPEDAAPSNLPVSLGPNKGHAWDMLEEFGAGPARALTLPASWATPALCGEAESIWPDIALSYGIGDAQLFGEIRRNNRFPVQSILING